MIIKNIYYNLMTILRICKHKTFLYRINTKPKKMGHRIVILGNSPDADIYFKHREEFLEYDLLTVNNFPLDEKKFMEYKPKYHCMVHPGMFDEGKFLFNEEKNREELKKVWEILKRVDWPLYIITYAGNKLPINNNNIRLIWLAPIQYRNESTDFQKWCFYNNLCLSASQNVATAGIQFAEIFGYSEIALFGITLNRIRTFFVNEKNQLLITDSHFYGIEEDSVANDTYLRQLRAEYNMFWGFEECKNLALSRDITVINYSPESFVQCFEKKKLS